MRVGLTGLLLALALGLPGLSPSVFGQTLEMIVSEDAVPTEAAEGQPIEPPAPGEAYLDALFARQMYFEPRLSPNGRYLAYLARSENEDDEAVYLIVNDLDAEPGSGQRITSFGGMSPNWVRWATNDRILVSVTLGLRARGRLRYLDGLPLVSRILSLDRSLEGAPVTMFGNASRSLNSDNWNLSHIVDMLPDDPDHILMPAHSGTPYHLWRVNIITGDVEMQDRGTRYTVAWYTVNGVAVMRAELLRHGNALKISTRNGANARWREAVTIRRRDVEERDDEFVWAGSTETPGQILVLARPEGTEFTGIYRYDLEASEFLEPVALRDDFDISAALVDPHTGAYRGYEYVADRRLYELESNTFRPQYAGLLNFFGDQMEINPVSFGGTRMVLRADGPAEPGSIYLYNLESHSVDPLFSLWPSLSTVPLFPVEALTVLAADGLSIPGYITWPAGGPGPDTPLIVYPHGGPEVRDRIAFSVMVQYLANLGYAVYQPNYRGSAGYGNSFLEAGHGEWGRAMQQDISAGVDVLASAGRIDRNQVCIMGFSYGGFAALAGSMMEPGRYRCAIAGGGVYDLAGFVNREDEDLREHWSTLIGDPGDAAVAEQLRATSPSLHADQLTLPVLLYHGDRDRIVPVDQSRAMAEALKQAGMPHVYIEDAGVGHGWGGDDESARRVFHNIRDFLADAMDGSLDTFEPELAPVDEDED